MLALGETRARTVLRNDSTEALTYRLAAANPALTLDTAPAKLAPGAEVDLIADVDLAALAPTDRLVPVQIITSGGAILWSLQIDALPEAGNFRGAVSFDIDGFSLHVAMRCGADDRQALEQLFRYIARPVLTNEREQTKVAGQAASR